ncbi:hypothetical protein [Acrocarpospora sp. B8E8]|uniref:hypothetical protein n=1 Tax=Acrocarpospora sp. B8E8 TaxID=3153572 RepID=UPI00325E82B3
MPRLAVIAGLGALGMFTMPMLHPHPSGSTDRITPGAVRVESESHVSITLFDDRSKLQQVVREYDTELAEGSGFTVTPDGVIVTATSVVQSDRDARIYAANRVFAEYFKVSIPADFEKHTISDPDLNIRLQACYPPRTQSSTCNATVTTTVIAYPYLQPPLPQGLKAEILHTGDSPVAPAVLKVAPAGKEGLPTVPLGAVLGTTVESIDVMTLATPPSAKAPPKLDTAHFDPPGSRSFKKEDQPKVDKLVAARDSIGGAVIDDGKSEVVGLLAGGGSFPATVTPVEDIKSALVAAGVSARRGPVDVVYESALASYHNKLYAASIPVLERVLSQRQDHPVAIEYLRIARTKANTGEDAGTKKPSAAPVAKQSTGISPWVWVTGGVVLVAALVAIAVPMLLKRRRGGNGPGGGPPLENAALVTSWPAQTEMFHGGGGSHPSIPPPPPGSDMSPPLGQAQLGQPMPVQVGQMGMQKFCTQCGMRLGHAHRFCGFCGHAADMP